MDVGGGRFGSLRSRAVSSTRRPSFSVGPRGQTSQGQRAPGFVGGSYPHGPQWTDEDCSILQKNVVFVIGVVVIIVIVIIVAVVVVANVCIYEFSESKSKAALPVIVC